MVNSRTLVACVCLFILLIMAMTHFNFFPYQNVNTGSFNRVSDSGDPTRQITYSLIIIGAIGVSLPTIRYTFRPTYHVLTMALITLWALLSLTWSPASDVAGRRLVLFVIIVITIISVTSNVTPKTLMTAMIVPTAFIMINNYNGIFFVAEQAIVGDEHGSAWRGLHSHKNTAGHISATSAIIWFFAGFVFRQRLILWTGAAAWAFFAYKSQSKSAWAALLIIPAAGYMLARFTAGPGARAKIILTMTVALVLLLIAVSFLSVEGLLDKTTGDASLTGRTDLWELVFDQIKESPYIGIGYQSFWITGGEASPLSAYDGWVSQALQAHNGYLDVVLTLGLVGLAAVTLFLASPVIDANRLGGSPIGITATYYSLWAYGLLINFVESSITRTDSVIWVYVMISIFGIRQLIGMSHRRPSNVVVSVRSSRM
jgi:O-antigen ligase